MMKKLWLWFWGPPCDHKWDTVRREVVKHGVMKNKEAWGELRPFTITKIHCTRFCVKCTKLIQYWE
jgi:hypothetical protein